MRRRSRGTVAALAAVAVLCTALLVAPVPAGALPTDAPEEHPLTRGTLDFGEPDPTNCPASGGYTCTAFTVTCAAPYGELQPIEGRMADGAAAAGVRFKGIVMFFVGNDGMEYWGGTVERRAFLDDLHAKGYRTVEVAWNRPYAQGAEGYRALTCRPAVAIEWGAAEYAVSGANPPAGVGVCGFCLVGTSAGSAQVAYPMVFHGLGDQVDAAIEVSGPAESDLVAACGRSIPVSPFQYPEISKSPARARVDGAWDNGAVNGPCEDTDTTVHPDWESNSLLAADATLDFPSTRWHFIWGSRDGTGAAGQGQLFLARLYDDGFGTTAVLHHDCMSGGHDLLGSPKALRQLKAAIEWKPTDGPDHPPPLVEPTVEPRCVVTRG